MQTRSDVGEQVVDWGAKEDWYLVHHSPAQRHTTATCRRAQGVQACKGFVEAQPPQLREARHIIGEKIAHSVQSGRTLSFSGQHLFVRSFASEMDLSGGRARIALGA
eukprot:6194483-Pleurochrysis_carterae.AAC.4